MFVVVSGSVWIDINNKGINKGDAVKKLQKDLNISYDETMVFGDYLNDAEMMASCNHSYAVANAHEEIKKMAKFIAPSNKKNGVLSTIENVILNNDN